MPDSGLHLLPVLDVRPAASKQVLLALGARGTPVQKGHVHPGQYALVKLGKDVPRPFAIASPPGSDRVELLLKLPPEPTAAVLALTRDDKIAVSAPRGDGFPLARAEGKSLWLVATGSGVAPLRAVIETLLPQRARFADVSLLYGVRHADELAFADRFGQWSGRGVKVIPVVSQPAPGTWEGPVGRVQDHLPARFERPHETWAFLCGLPEMDREVSAALLSRGVGPDQIFRNY